MRPFRMLLVEDSASDARLVREAAKEASLPVEIRVAENGVEAMDYLGRAAAGEVSQPDLILLDLNLPGKDGREVLADIKNSPRLKHLPVIVMTSSPAEADIAAAYELNANGYVTKPPDLGGFVRAIASIENFWFLTATLPDGFQRPVAALASSR